MSVIKQGITGDEECTVRKYFDEDKHERREVTRKAEGVPLANANGGCRELDLRVGAEQFRVGVANPPALGEQGFCRAERFLDLRGKSAQQGLRPPAVARHYAPGTLAFRQR